MTGVSRIGHLADRRISEADRRNGSTTARRPVARRFGIPKSEPGARCTARLRNLINEEGSDLRSFDLDRLPVGHRLQNDPEQALPERRSPYATRSEEASRRYIFDNFESNDRLAVMVRNQATNHTLQRIARAETIASPEFQAWLRYKNATGFDIYLSLNILKPHAHGRTKADIHKIRHLYLDLDQQAPQKLGTIYQSAAIPLPNYVLETSPNKYQVIWQVEGITQNRAEQLLRGLAQRFGGDPAATDAARVFRLPGFNNKKYSPDFTVKVERTNLPEAVYHESDFKVETSRREPVLNAGDGRVEKRDLSLGSGKTQSERDWAYVICRLREKVAPRTWFRTSPLFALVIVLIPSIPQNGLPAENQIQFTTLNAQLGEPWSTWVRPPARPTNLRIRRIAIPLKPN